ncbi:MAG: heme-binding protein [Burkholderiales bacterium]
MISLKNLLLALALLLTAATAYSAPVAEKKVLTLDGARQVITAAVAEAKKLNAPGGVIAVVDDGGNLMALERLDNTFAAGANISVGKARTAALFKKPTKVFEDIVNKGRTTMVALNDFTPLQGGVPIIVEGQIVGAVGVSGASSAQQDEEIAIAGANSLSGKVASASAPSVTFIGSEKVSAAFAKGAPLKETAEYKIHASRRTEPGLVEIHVHETDTIYVLEGGAMFVTGGKAVNPKLTAPGEIRGTDVIGGETRRLSKGDVMVVPEGVPHWFKEIDGTFLYYVVKVISPGG